MRRQAQQHLCIATENGSLETRCAKYGTLFLRFPDLARRFGNPQVMLTKDGDVLFASRVQHKGRDDARVEGSDRARRQEISSAPTATFEYARPRCSASNTSR